MYQHSPLHKENAALHYRSERGAPQSAETWSPTTNPGSPNRRLTPQQNILVHYLFHHQCCEFIFLPGTQGKSTWNAWQGIEAPEIVNTIKLKPVERSIWLKDKHSHSIHAWPKTNWESRRLYSLLLNHDFSSAVLERFPTNAALQHCAMIRVALWDGISHRKRHFWGTALSKHCPISPFFNWSNSRKFTVVMSGWEARKGGKTVFCVPACVCKTTLHSLLSMGNCNITKHLQGNNKLKVWHWQGEFPALLWPVSPSPRSSQPTCFLIHDLTFVAEDQLWLTLGSSITFPRESSWGYQPALDLK